MNRRSFLAALTALVVTPIGVIKKGLWRRIGGMVGLNEAPRRLLSVKDWDTYFEKRQMDRRLL